MSSPPRRRLEAADHLGSRDVSFSISEYAHESPRSCGPGAGIGHSLLHVQGCASSNETGMPQTRSTIWERTGGARADGAIPSIRPMCCRAARAPCLREARPRRARGAAAGPHLSCQDNTVSTRPAATDATYPTAPRSWRAMREAAGAGSDLRPRRPRPASHWSHRVGMVLPAPMRCRQPRVHGRGLAPRIRLRHHRAARARTQGSR